MSLYEKKTWIAAALLIVGVILWALSFTSENIVTIARVSGTILIVLAFIIMVIVGTRKRKD